MSAAHVRRFVPSDTDAVTALILSIQRQEFDIPITKEDQPDLRDIPSFYQSGVGDFLVAEDDGQVVGTIGLKDIGTGGAALRKMFVAASHRGARHGVAQALLDALVDLARSRAIADVWLGATDRFVAAHRFYERNHFRRIDPAARPDGFPRMAVDMRFYHRLLLPLD